MLQNENSFAKNLTRYSRERFPTCLPSDRFAKSQDKHRCGYKTAERRRAGCLGSPPRSRQKREQAWATCAPKGLDGEGDQALATCALETASMMSESKLLAGVSRAVLVRSYRRINVTTSSRYGVSME